MVERSDSNSPAIVPAIVPDARRYDNECPHARFILNLDRYRDATTWGNFVENFKSLPFFPKLRRMEESLMDQQVRLETTMIKEFIHTLSHNEVLEWINVAEAYVARKRRPRSSPAKPIPLLEQHSLGSPSNVVSQKEA